MAILCNYSALFVLPPHLTYPCTHLLFYPPPSLLYSSASLPPLYFSPLPPPFFSLPPPPPPPPFVLMRNFLRVNTNLPCYSREATISNIAHWKSCPKYFGFFFIPLNKKKMITLNKLGLLKCSKLVENL